MEYAYITADEYSAEEVIQMEKKMITLLDFNLFSPGTAHFHNLYFRVLHFEDARVRVLADYLADILMLNIDSLQYPPSLLSSAIIFMSALTL